jgi:hypothetical protein
MAPSPSISDMSKRPERTSPIWRRNGMNWSAPPSLPVLSFRSGSRTHGSAGAEAVPLEGLADPVVLALAAEEGRVLVSHDVIPQPGD